ncbi:hypothetical protein MPLDJ20_230086 [Mesorhizobium plurifarium]|uniref:Uncharacterized protein n=1 Tax=Mesorhizobium plurifarium TaxID=69974 RepID=A0A090F9Y9_MESPL|nr:hypothetical protein MPLDJ20_230086 [Mesorhizobium plurifarium]
MSANELAAGLAFENPRKLRQSVMEITYGSGSDACRRERSGVFGPTTCQDNDLKRVA